MLFQKKYYSVIIKIKILNKVIFLNFTVLIKKNDYYKYL